MDWYQNTTTKNDRSVCIGEEMGFQFWLKRREWRRMRDREWKGSPEHGSNVLKGSLPQGPSAHPRNTEDASIRSSVKRTFTWCITFIVTDDSCWLSVILMATIHDTQSVVVAFPTLLWTDVKWNADNSGFLSPPHGQPLAIFRGCPVLTPLLWGDFSWKKEEKKDTCVKFAVIRVWPEPLPFDLSATSK